MVRQNQGNKVVTLLQKPKEYAGGSHAVSPFIPSAEQMRKFKLPLQLSRIGNMQKPIAISQIKDVASTAELSDFGIDRVPPGRKPEYFLEGFRWGLAHNARTNAKKMTHSHNHGFCFAKFIYKKFANGSHLSAPGGRWFKITAVE